MVEQKMIFILSVNIFISIKLLKGSFHIGLVCEVSTARQAPDMWQSVSRWVGGKIGGPVGVKQAGVDGRPTDELYIAGVDGRPTGGL